MKTIRKLVAGILPVITCLIYLMPVILLAQQPLSPAGYVNPFIGTGGHGHTFPGATVPFGMVQLSPDTRLEGWDGCSGYHYSDSIIYGFSHTHLSGTGCSDYGDILLMPVTGETSLDDYGYASGFSKQQEKASAGYYQVYLKDNQALAELTATARAGFHRYTYAAGGKTGIVIDLKHRDKVLESGLKVTGPDEVEGFRISKAWASKQMVYFVARFSRPFDSHVVTTGKKINPGLKETDSRDIRALFSFTCHPAEQIMVKVGISGVSIEGARKNLEAEIPGWDFDAVAGQAGEAWDHALRSITVEGGTEDEMYVFYTALYHAMIQPNLYNDTDGSYRGRDLQVHQAEGFNYYTVFSLWDTYRAANPLYTIIAPDRVNDFIRTFLRQYEEGGMLPVWELSGNETGCMIGYHAVPVIADAWQKGIRGYDGELALKAMLHSANQDHLGLKYYKAKGYIPADKESESVSKTLEYAYDDWCIAMMAKSMEKKDIYKEFIMRAQNYKNVYDRITGFMRAKSNETWFTPFDPAEVNFNYTEANAWQYSFCVPQDITGLARMMGGKDPFVRKLDDLFSADPKTTGREQADISGMIGQYAHGNEPSHHMAYLYDYAGVPWKTQELVHRICHEFYKNSPDGLIGNEDCGQMSAWYIFSAMGFYPVTPGSGIYAIGSPLFPRATIRLGNNKTLLIRTINAGGANCYIQSASLNGKPYTKCYISHTDIQNGGELTFTMGPQPNKAWAAGFGSFPEAYLSDYLITPVPSIHEGSETFLDSNKVAVSSANPVALIHYTLDGSEPSMRSATYLRPFLLRKSATLRAFAVNSELQKSYPIEARFIRIPKDRRITIKYPYAGQYSAGGDLALIDFLRGGDDFRSGRWQGYEGVDMDVTVDLGSVQQVKRLSLGCIQDQGSWIFMPEQVTFMISDNGVDFKEVVVIRNETDEEAEGTITHDFTADLSKGTKTRYVRAVAKNRAICPGWHPGAGKKAWVFADEVVVE